MGIGNIISFKDNSKITGFKSYRGIREISETQSLRLHTVTSLN
ncbi:hypothetical protein FCR2A7T_17950 [Flavobacterium cauense R2A-7]|nr:hypothetical protein FCR2A7T_17950 [Flavobacterium cauense R2A-7]